MVTGPTQTAVVTGASRGIGEAIARRLAGAGWSVIALDRAPVEIAGVDWLDVDLVDPSSIEAAAAAIAARGQTIDAIVNNAAVQGGQSIAEQSIGEWQRFLDVNVTAPWLVIKCLLQQLGERAGILNIGSVASVTGFADRAAYVSSKHALLGLTRALAVELAPRGIRVNMLCLGTFETPTLLELAGDRLPIFASRQLLNRLGRPDEAADAAMFLLSEQASFVTGSLMTVDGGMLAKGA